LPFGFSFQSAVTIYQDEGFLITGKGSFIKREDMHKITS